MTSYLVHLPAGARRGSADGLDRAVVVKDGFHWIALVVPLLWLLFNRLWLAFLAVLAIGLVIAALGAGLGLPEGITVALELLLSLAVGMWAADLKSRGLRRRGMPLADVVVARNEEDALHRFAERWLAGVAAAEPQPRASQTLPPRVTSDPTVLGLFPDAGRP